MPGEVAVHTRARGRRTARGRRSPGPARWRWRQPWRGPGQGRHLVVQAGTGTGKSLAYLVPAALAGSRVVVATATKALQDQLAGKDLPLVAEAVEQGLDFAVLKGRSNYVCRQRVSEIGGTGGQLTLATGSADPPDADDTLTPRSEVDTSDPATTRRPGAQPGALGPGLGHRRPGRAAVRAPLPGLGHGVDHGTGVPGRLPVPVGPGLLRRGRPGEGRRCRRRRREHPSVRCAPGQRRRRPARAPGRRVRRGPRGRGRDDRQPRSGGRPGQVPGAGRRGPIRCWTPPTTGPAVPSRPWPTWPTCSTGSSARGRADGCPSAT